MTEADGYHPTLPGRLAAAETSYIPPACCKDNVPCSATSALYACRSDTGSGLHLPQQLINGLLLIASLEQRLGFQTGEKIFSRAQCQPGAHVLLYHPDGWQRWL